MKLLSFSGFADDEGTFSGTWTELKQKLGALLFRWPSGCIEENVLPAVPEAVRLKLFEDRDGLTGPRLRTLQERLGTPDKDLATVTAAAGEKLLETMIQAARFVVEEPNYRGVSKALRHLGELISTAAGFKGDIKIDNYKEFWEAARLADYPSIEEAFANITHKRTYSHPKPPPQAISTVHKAKGLECGAVLLVGCDASQFPDTPQGRALLYVALSRATSKLMIVVPRSSPSPLFQL